MPSLLLVRHGQASFGGENYDVLSERGHEQAAALARDIADRGVKIDRMITGDMARQRDTAAPLAEQLGLEVTVDPRWNEYDAGDILEHHSDSDVRDSAPEGSEARIVSSREFQDILEVAMAKWVRAGADGPAKETWAQFAQRTRGALREAGESLASGETLMVCTSGGVLGSICTQLLDIPDERFIAFNRVTINASATKVAVGRSGMTLVSFNEHAYLEPQGLVTYR